MVEQTGRNAPSEVDWINTCKGLGIYLVVLGHSHIHAGVQQFIYAFHMPLFFYLSGYVHSVKADTRGFFSKKCVQLLLPYVSFLVVLYPLHSLGTLRHHGWNHQMVENAIYSALWGGSRLREAFGVFWFLPCLFFTQQAVNFLLLRFRLAVAGIVVAAAMILAYANARYLPQFGLPLDLNVVLAAMPFFYLGFIAKRRAWPNPMVEGLGVLGMGLAAYLIYLKVPISYNMRDGVYGIPGLSFILAFCLIVSLQSISRMLIAIKPLRNVTTLWGLASLGIMFIHKEVMDVAGFCGWSQKNGYLASIVIAVISCYLTASLRLTVVTRAFFLGSEKDFYKSCKWVVSLSNTVAGPVGRAWQGFQGGSSQKLFDDRRG